MAKNYFERYIWLIDLINLHGHIRFEEINRAWAHSSLNTCGSASLKQSELPQRTFFNHIEAIYEMFGIEIKCDRSLGYYIANSEDMDGDDVRKWLLGTLSMNNLLNESRDMREKILFEEIPASQRWLSVVVNAMRSGNAVEMTYKSYARSEPNTFVAHPYCLKLFKQRWYVLARSEEYDRPRIYALDERTLNVVPVKKKLKVPAKFNAAEFFSNYYGIIVGNDCKPAIVDLKVIGDQVPYFESLPLHKSQEMIESTPEYTVFRYHLVPTYDFLQEVLRHGADVEVLSPQEFREEVADSVKAMMNLYE